MRLSGSGLGPLQNSNSSSSTEVPPPHPIKVQINDEAQARMNRLRESAQTAQQNASAVVLAHARDWLQAPTSQYTNPQLWQSTKAWAEAQPWAIAPTPALSLYEVAACEQARRK